MGGQFDAGPVPLFRAQPRPGSRRRLTATPPPYAHPRILFTEADRPDLTRRALQGGGGSDPPAPTAVARVAFAELSAWVERVVYAADSPIKQIFDVLAGTLSPQRPCGDPRKAFEGLQALVTDPGSKPPGAVVQGAFYTRMFDMGVAPATKNYVLKNSGIMPPPPATDTTPSLGVKLLFASQEAGVPGFYSPVYDAVQNAAYVAWLRGEQKRLEYLAGVLAVAAGVHLLFHARGSLVLVKGEGGFCKYNTGPRSDSSASPELAFAYDLLFTASLRATGSRAQLAPVRRLLLRMGRNRVASAFNADPYRMGKGAAMNPFYTGTTFQLATALVLLVQYAVEGEEEDDWEEPWDEAEREEEEERKRKAAEGGGGGGAGGAGGGDVRGWREKVRYDAVAVDLNVKSLFYYLTYAGACDPTGVTREFPGYFMTPMRQAAFPILAVTRRGHDMFGDLTNTYQLLMDVFQTLAPWSLAPPCFGAQDGTCFCGGFSQSEYYLLVKYLFPGDPLTDFVYQKYNTQPRTKVIGGFGVNKMPFQTCLLGMDVTARNVSFLQVASAAGLPLVLFANRLGTGTARSGWGDGRTGAAAAASCVAGAGGDRWEDGGWEAELAAAAAAAQPGEKAALAPPPSPAPVIPPPRIPLPSSSPSLSPRSGPPHVSTDEQGLLLFFECRPDTYFLDHCHASRNDFYLLGCSRAWICPAPYHNVENEACASILIDGLGQGGSHTLETQAKGFPLTWSCMPGKVVATWHEERMSYFAGDASAAYRFVTKGWQVPRPAARPQDDNNIETPYAWKDFYYQPVDFGPSLVPKIIKKGAAGVDPVVEPEWVEDNAWASWHICAREEFNPVRYAFRTAALIRPKASHVHTGTCSAAGSGSGNTTGKDTKTCPANSPLSSSSGPGPGHSSSHPLSRPFAIIVDDVRKDERAHTYTWVANTTQPYMANVGYGHRLFLLTGPQKQQAGAAVAGKPAAAAAAAAPAASDVVIISPSEASRYASLDPTTDAVFIRGDDVHPKTRHALPGTPRMLLRVLQGDGHHSAPIRLVKVEDSHSPQGPGSGKGPYYAGVATGAEYWRVEIERKQVVEPGFKIMLLPFIEGEELPVTQWHRGRGSEGGDGSGGSGGGEREVVGGRGSLELLTVTWGGGACGGEGGGVGHEPVVDFLLFEKGGDNRTRVTLLE
ncbi:hypothetical protein CLOP_g7857 [Closterium sp. NIES-67]|nr:hypothetical protein CLOP_g7857 [Closterium sp. NIES-67]